MLYTYVANLSIGGSVFSTHAAHYVVSNFCIETVDFVSWLFYEWISCLEMNVFGLRIMFIFQLYSDDICLYDMTYLFICLSTM
jgi:hypothetical protein